MIPRLGIDTDNAVRKALLEVEREEKFVDVKKRVIKAIEAFVKKHKKHLDDQASVATVLKTAKDARDDADLINVVTSLGKLIDKKYHAGIGDIFDMI